MGVVSRLRLALDVLGGSTALPLPFPGVDGAPGEAEGQDGRGGEVAAGCVEGAEGSSGPPGDISDAGIRKPREGDGGGDGSDSSGKKDHGVLQPWRREAAAT